MTVEYAQVCCSVLVTILITNYMMLGYTWYIPQKQYAVGLHSSSMICWVNSWPVYYAAHYPLQLCTPRKNYQVSCHSLWLHIARLRPTLSCLHKFVCLICVLPLCIIWFWWYMHVDWFYTSQFTYFNSLTVLFPLPGSTHNFWRYVQLVMWQIGNG